MDFNNLIDLQKELKKREKESEELAKESFGGENVELTQQERDRLAELENTRRLVVSETTQTGMKKDTGLAEYAKSLDDRMAAITESAPMRETLKLINSGDITKSTEEMKAQTRENAIKAFRELSVTEEDISDDDYMEINNRTFAALQQYFNMERMDADIIVKKLSKLSLRQICDILPAEFTKTYVTEHEIAINHVKAKERMLASLSYLAVTGPEMDYLNEYIEDENRLAMVSQRLLQCQVDFADMIKDERTMSEIIRDTVDLCPVDTSFWAKYIKMPNRVHNEFAQRVVLQTRYKEAYEQILEEYPAISLEEYADQPEELSEKAREAAVVDRARAMIQAEIDEASNKIDVYTNVTEMELLKEKWPMIVGRFGPNSKQKKMSMDYLIKEAVAAIERIRRCKQDLPFPGYDGSKRPEAIFMAFVRDYTHMIERYNAAATEISEKEPDQDVHSFMIRIDGIPDEATATVLAISVALLMGRIVKALTKNTSTKYDAIMLDSYFQLFCRMGLDIYIMQDVWSLVKDFVEYTVRTYYNPATDAAKKKMQKRDLNRIPKNRGIV